jgi:NADH dehydrogenase (ubiquinone) 1 alpha subcomplex subunit 5
MLFRVTAVLRQAAAKTSTGIVGLPVDPNARANLIALQKKLLVAAKTLPAENEYRVNIEKVAAHRLKACEELETDEEVEKEIMHGQLEELIEAAKEELELVAFYKENGVHEIVEKMKERPSGELKREPWELPL